MLAFVFVSLAPATDSSFESIELSWEQTYDPKGYAYNAIKTSDGGYAFACVSEEYHGADTSVMLIKTDSSGRLEWQKLNLHPGIAKTIFQTTDGGYVIAGTQTGLIETDILGHYQSVQWTRFFLLKTDSNGEVIWRQAYGAQGTYSYSVNGVNVNASMPADAELYLSICTSDGGYVLLGTLNWMESVWAVKTDEFGKEMWNQTYRIDDEKYYRVYFIEQTSEGYNILANSVFQNMSECHDWLIKTDKMGTVIENIVCNSEWKQAHSQSALKGVDGNYVWARSNNMYAVDPQGNIKWNMTYNSFKDPYQGLALASGGYIFLSINGSDRSLIKIDSDGNYEWSKKCNTPTFPVIEESDGSIVFIGSRTEGYPQGKYDDTRYKSWVVFAKTEPLPD